MNDIERLNKNQNIRESNARTRLKRKNQSCKTFKFKINRSHLTSSQSESLKMFFVESKRIYNYLISEMKKGKDIFEYDYKTLKNITYLDKDRNPIQYAVKYVGSSVVQDIIRNIKDSIYGLSSSKKNSNKVGALGYKSECNSIRFIQYGVTHHIKGNRIKIQGIKKPIRVSGLKQLEKYDNIDYTIANLLYDGYDYHITLTCYVDKTPIKTTYKDNIVGIDFGCESTITLSNGEKKKISIGESDRLKGLQARLAHQKKRSNNWYKTRSLIRKEYNHISNQKNDAANKIVHDLVYNYRIIVMQDDQFNEWKEGDHNYTTKTVQHSVLGRIKTRLRRYDNVVEFDRWFPTTKHCFNCGSDINLTLSDRTFKCPVCGLESDRDVHAANNMVEFYNRYIQWGGTLHLKPRRKVLYNTYTKLSRQEAQSL